VTRSRTSGGAKPRITRYSRNPGGNFNPLTDITWYTASYAEDPLWTDRPADGFALVRLPAQGTDHTDGITANGLVSAATGSAYAVSFAEQTAFGVQDATFYARLSLADWTPAATNIIIAHGSGTVGPIFSVETDGTIALWDKGAGTTLAKSTAATGHTDGVTNYYWIKAEFRSSDRRVQFFTSATNTDTLASVVWSQLGTDVTWGVAGWATGTLNWTVGGYGGTAGFVSPGFAGRIRQAGVHTGLHSGGASTEFIGLSFTTATTGASSLVPTGSSGLTVFNVFSRGDLVQFTSTKRPLFRATGINGLPSIQPDGTDDFLQTASGASFASLNSPYSVVAIGSIAGAGASPILLDGIGAGNRGALLYKDGTPDWATVYGVGGTPDSNTHLFANIINGASSRLLVDNAQVATGTHSAALTGLTAFINYLGAANPANSHLAFVGVYNGDITADANWARFMAWTARYGITVA
jgi:hypothetical protein